MEQHVVLHGRERQLEQVPDEVGHDRTAAAALRIKMRDIGNRHVEREIEILVPLRPPIQNSGPKSGRSVLFAIAIDRGSAASKFFPVIKKSTVVIQVLDADFTP